MDELLDQFVIEGRELVQQAADGLLALEHGGFDAGHVDAAFRAIHTLKGSAGLFDMAPLGRLLHAAEDLMAGLRQARQAPAPDVLDALLDCVAAAGGWVEDVARDGALPDSAGAESARLTGQLLAAAGEAPPAPSQPQDATPAWLAALGASDPAGDARSAFRYVPDARCFFLGDDPVALVCRVPALLALRLQPRTPWRLEAYDPFACNLVLLGLSAASAADLREVFRFAAGQAEVVTVGPAQEAEAHAPSPPARQPAREAGRTLRVEAGRIDALASLVGELLVARNRLSHVAAQAGEAAGLPPELARGLAATGAELDRLAGSMHRAVMGLRLVPLEQSFRRLPLLVRETASRLGREVRFTTEGGAVQADKATVDGLFEPLLHVLRNAVDHGIAPPAARLAAGKPAHGEIVLRAALDGERVVVTVTDDGAGLDPAALRRAAASRGLASEAALAALDDAGLAELVFLPGFSTAASVTDTSGRGVGMDAVRTALAALGGRAGIAPAAGGGTVVTLQVPQSLSVTTVLLVEVGGERFGVPAEAVREMARLGRDAIRPVQDQHAFVLRDRTLPLLDLARLLGRLASPERALAHVLVTGSAAQPVGLEVDGFGARADIVLQPLPALLARVPGLRGSAVLGDGSVLLVLDVAGLIG